MLARDIIMSDYSLKKNFNIFILILMKWPNWTIAALSAVIISHGYYFVFEYGMHGIDTAFSVGSCILILAFFKVIILMSFFKFFFGRKFDSSLLILSIFNSALFVLAALFLSVVLNNNTDDFPFIDLIWILPILAFIFCFMTLVVSAFLHKIT
jgi:hypothetical protein